MSPLERCRRTGSWLVVGLALAAHAAAEDLPLPPPIAITRLSSPVTLDGDLSDAAWSQAAVIDRFYETLPGDNVTPPVATRAYLAYDDEALYIGLRCEDPEPGAIRAPIVERDNVFNTDDNVAIFLDPRNDRRSAVELRVTPRGIQSDAVLNDANRGEDFAPDFAYEARGRVTEFGWSAELRVPFSSLRYPRADPQDWGILFWRTYPRKFRYTLLSSPVPRNSQCLLCRAATLSVRGLPRNAGLLVVPYATALDTAEQPAPGQPLGPAQHEADVGGDLKWTPGASTAIDLTVNPDFSQIESDVAQIAVNNRFALFYPEKRPFFLEGVDLLDTPLSAVYTRTVTSPSVGLRGTGKVGRTAITALFAEDRGGGSVIIPGPVTSSLAPQDFHSRVGTARIRHDLGGSFVGLLATGRQIDGGGHNVVLGPDLQWRPGSHDTITGQWLWSDSVTPQRPDLEPTWDGRALQGGALHLQWLHDTEAWRFRVLGRDVGEGFRDDQGYVPQVGYRQAVAEVDRNFYPSGVLRFVQPWFQAEQTIDTQGELVQSRLVPSLYVEGARNLQAELTYPIERIRSGTRVLPRQQLTWNVQFDPGRRVPRILLRGFLGDEVDFENGERAGRGGELRFQLQLRPSSHLTLDLVSSRSWLDVAPGAPPRSPLRRLFTAQVQRAKATLGFSSRAFLRVVAQYVSTDRDPDLYSFPVRASEGDFTGSLLLSYRLNWQTAFYLGYGDERTLDEGGHGLSRTSRQLFVKASYAFQR
jgi:hypothetical protein